MKTLTKMLPVTGELCASFLSVINWLSAKPAHPHRSPNHATGEGSDRVVVLDASPSMLDEDWPPTRLAGAQKAAIAYVRRVACKDPLASVAIVRYSTRAKAVCSLQPVTDLRRIEKGIRNLKTGQFTNITAGLSCAFELLKGRPRPAQVILLTDGNHNTGSAPHAIAEELRRFAVVETIGIGRPGSVDIALLKEIASRYPDGRPRYRWIGDAETLVEEFKSLGGRITRS
jgi:Mg-chelatase subunit ChlD